MKRRFVEIVDMIEFNELVNMKRDLSKGGMEIDKIISDRIKEEIKKHEVCCSICNSKIDPYSTTNFTLIFGPEDLKKKASFCAIDCLEYFLRNLKDLRKDMGGKGSIKKEDECMHMNDDDIFDDDFE